MDASSSASSRVVVLGASGLPSRDPWSTDLRTRSAIAPSVAPRAGSALSGVRFWEELGGRSGGSSGSFDRECSTRRLNGWSRYIVIMSASTLYAEIEEALAAEIAQGEYSPGDQLPTEDELLQRFQVNRITVSRAIQNLVGPGLLEIRRGLGTSVLSPRIEAELTKLTGFVEEAAFLVTAFSSDH